MPLLITHFRIISAFVLREIATRYGKSPGGYVWALLEPIAFISLMTAIMGAIGRVPAMGDSFPLFYATGFLAFQMFKSMESYVTSSISANKNLMAYPKVAPIDAVIARFILQGATSTLVGIVIIGGSLLTVRYMLPIHWAYILEAIAYAWILALGIALCNSILFFRFPIYEKIFSIVTRPLFLLSGVFYIPSQMPSPFSNYLLLNPVSHIVILFREGFYGRNAMDGLDIWFLNETSLVMLFMGMLLFTVWPVARKQG